MRWVPDCLLDDAGKFILKGEGCFAGLEPWDIITWGGFSLAGVIAVAGALWWFFRRAILPPNPDWPEVANLASQPRPPHLVRRGEMTDLSRRIARAKGTVVEAAVAGLGGSGKTTLALAVARDEARRFRGVWVVRAANSDTILDSLKGLALRLELPGADGPEREAIARAALDAVAADKAPWLLVYDNADDPGLARDYSPKDAQNVTLLFTSRSGDWPEDMKQPLGRMNRAQAVEMLGSNLPGFAQDELIAVAERLANWPLALTAAIGFLRREGATVADYLAKFDTTREEMTKLDWSGSAYFVQDRPETHTIAAALRLTTDTLAQRERVVLSLLCWLNPDDLWPEMVEAGVRSELRSPFQGQALPPDLQQVAAEEGWLTAAMGRLADAFLVERDGDSLTMHRLLAEFWRATLADAADWRQAVSQVANAETPAKPSSPANWKKLHRLMPQARALLTHGAKDAAAARFFAQIGTFAFSYGAQPGDIRLIETSVTILEALVPGTKSLAASLNNLAEFQKQAGQFDRALDTLERVRGIEAGLPEIGPDHPSYAITLNNIAGIHWRRKDHAAAEALLQEALRIDRASLGADHPDTITDDRNLAALYGDWAQVENPDVSEDLRQKQAHHEARALAQALRSLGPHSARTAIDRNNAAVRLSRAGDVAAALEPMRQATATQLDLLAPGDERVVNCLGAYLSFAGKTGLPPDAAIKALAEEIRTQRAAHQAWGMARMDWLFDRYQIAEGTLQDRFEALVPAVHARMADLRAEGKPDELILWLQQELNEAVHAVNMDPTPGPGIDDRFQAAMAALAARQGG